MAKEMACFNSGNCLGDHFVDVTEMIAIGSETNLLLRQGYALA